MADQTRFSVKNLGVFFVLGGAAILARIFPGGNWTALIIVLIGLIIICAAWTYLLGSNLRSERRLTREWFFVGDRLIEQLSIHNQLWLPAVWLEFKDGSTVPSYRSSVAYEVPANFSLHWRVMSSCRRRGRYQLGPWALTTGDPFGIFEVTLEFETVKEIIIFPPGDANVALDVPLGILEGDISASKRSLQLTETVSTLRDYSPGDPLKWIHWPTTAHKGALMVRQFDRNIRGDIWLLLDGEQSIQLGTGIESTEEIGVLLAAALLKNLTGGRHQVGLMTFGEAIAIVSPGDSLHQWRSNYQLAVFEANGTMSIFEALFRTKGTISQGSSVIIITADDDPAFLHSLTALSDQKITATVLLFDRSSFGGHSRVDLRTYSQEVQERGHQLIPIKKGDITSPTYESGKESNWITTPLGRAIELNRE